MSAPLIRGGPTGALLTREVERLLAAKEVVVCCGPGGVGKTTTAASIAATAAVRLGGKVLVVTVDPARRLADALGVGGLGNEVTRVPPEAFADAGAHARGELWAAMLDMSQSWDALVRRYAPDPPTAEQIVANPLYRNITRRFSEGHAYIAMERLYELHEEGDYDLVVVDTPPSRNALDLLDAPGRMSEFFSSRLLRWLIVPYRSRLVNAASRPFYQVADRLLGSQFLEDLAAFFILFQTMRDGFVARADAVQSLLRDVRTTFVVVTTLEAVPAVEARELIDSLSRRQLHLGLLVCNKVLPDSFADPAAGHVADLLGAQAGEIAGPLALSLAAVAPAPSTRAAGHSNGFPARDRTRDRARGEKKTLPLAPDATVVAKVLEEVASSFANFRLVANRESELLRELGASHEVTATVPYHAGHVTDLRGLLDIGDSIWGDGRDRPIP